jgi:hypothetical protein
MRSDRGRAGANPVRGGADIMAMDHDGAPGRIGLPLGGTVRDGDTSGKATTG